MPPIPVRPHPLTASHFIVAIDGIANTLVREVCGLEASIDVIEHQEGSDKATSARKLPGLRKFTNITLKRGFTSDLSLWNWFNGALSGNVVCANGKITLVDEQSKPIVSWLFRNGWPCKWTGPCLNATSNDVAIETIEISHEGLELTAG